MLVILILAGSLLGVGAWLGYGRWQASTLASTTPASTASLSTAATSTGQPSDAPAGTATLFYGTIDPQRLELANSLAAARLWRLAFALPAQAKSSEAVPHRVRDNIVAMLQVDAVNPDFFPRRPALMTQLLQAVNDPRAASDKLSRMISRDPVLTADVLRLANSGYYATSSTPIETIQRAIVVCGVDALRGMLASAMLRPVFRATRENFPRLPRMLWERTERATRAAELYAMETHPHDRFEAQLLVLLSALGPLVVYGAALDVYARNPNFSPSGALCAELIGALAPQMSHRIARNWQTSPRLLAALEKSSLEPLTTALSVGEFLGTLSFLESHNIISPDERLVLIENAGIACEATDRIWAGLAIKV